MNTPPCQTGGANRRGAELPVVASDALVVVSEGNNGVIVSVESDVRSFAQSTRDGANVSPSPGSDSGADFNHAGSPGKASESSGVVL